MKDETVMETCRECSGKGSDNFHDIEDYYPCPMCEGTGQVQKGTKTWLEKLFDYKPN